MTIKIWPKIGQPEILAESRNKALVRQWFLDPYKNEPSDFSLFSGLRKVKSTIILPLTSNGEVVIVKQFRPAANQIILELPGGEPKAEEISSSPLAVGQREMLEETGYVSEQVISLAPLVYFEPGFAMTGYCPCLALECKKVSEPKPDPDEHIEIEVISLSVWLRQIFQGCIVDSKSMVVTLLALPYIFQKYPNFFSPELFSISEV